MAARPSLKLHWPFKDDASLTDRIAGLTWSILSGPPTVFSADGLELGGTDSMYNITSGVDDTLIGTTGLLYAECAIDTADTVDQYLFTISDGGETDFIQIRLNALEIPEGIIVKTSSVESEIAGGSITLGETFRFAYSWGVNESRIFFNGVLQANDFTVAPPSGFTTLHLGRSSVTPGPGWHGPCGDLRYYDDPAGGTGDILQFMEDLTLGLINEDPDEPLPADDPSEGGGGSGGPGGPGDGPGQQNRNPGNPGRPAPPGYGPPPGAGPGNGGPGAPVVTPSPVGQANSAQARSTGVNKVRTIRAPRPTGTVKWRRPR